MATQVTSPKQLGTQTASEHDPDVTITKLGPGGLTGAALRYDGWASRHGWQQYNFNWGAIRANSHVFVSVSEVTNNGDRFLGLAHYTVHNIAPHDGRVEFVLFIDWGSDIRVSTDILVIDP